MSALPRLVGGFGSVPDVDTLSVRNDAEALILSPEAEVEPGR